MDKLPPNILKLVDLINEWATKSSDDFIHRREIHNEVEKFTSKEIALASTHLLDRTNDPNVKMDILTLLAEYSPKTTVPYLLDLIDSENASMRRMCCGYLSRAREKSTVPLLVELLENDPSPDVREMAAFALGKIGDPQAIPHLRRAQKTDHARDSEGGLVSESAKRAIERIFAR
jgi:HEAT repeat protein